eukprot:363790-Chlamydomonas_euryale.AAC.30
MSTQCACHPRLCGCLPALRQIADEGRTQAAPWRGSPSADRRVHIPRQTRDCRTTQRYVLRTR